MKSILSPETQHSQYFPRLSLIAISWKLLISCSRNINEESQKNLKNKNILRKYYLLLENFNSSEASFAGVDFWYL